MRALIVDDEALARANLRHAISEATDWEVVGECASVASARLAIAELGIDVVFLDIQMPGESGLTLARELVSRTSPPVIVFVTAYDEYSIEAFEVQALDYLLKPFDDERLGKTLQRASELVDLRQRKPWSDAVEDAVGAVESARENRTGSKLTRICVRSVGHIETIRLDDVRWISSAGNYIELHMDDRNRLHRSALAQFERHLDPTDFLRVHRTALVRRASIRALKVTGDGTYELTLDSGEAVAVSERHVAFVRTELSTR
jgi:two-component system, LytTR family, response regulator